MNNAASRVGGVRRRGQSVHMNIPGHPCASFPFFPLPRHHCIVPGKPLTHARRHHVGVVGSRRGRTMATHSIEVNHRYNRQLSRSGP